ncbi:hypothetical protein CYMTET_34021 [Cymbomonas tetramitiformis]|uniref:Uncharacterized protein n=1 Tax=Cymbomonas tetramitiformis TaxID=36881 RepID=A0AAE0FBY6_9CHLO|nr:hypothetical protein CYMTET_34021 [Cymbomonas tetramitiformis]
MAREHSSSPSSAKVDHNSQVFVTCFAKPAWSTSMTTSRDSLVDHADLAEHVTNTWELWSILALEGLEEYSGHEGF